MISEILLLLLYLIEGVKICGASGFDHLTTEHNFLTHYNVNYATCVDECDRRGKCSGVQYSHRRLACHLMEAGFVTPDEETTQKYKIYRKTHPLTSVTCGATPETCDENQACDSQTNTCLIKECDRFDDKRIAIVSGNVQTVGSHVTTECKPGAVLPDGTTRTRHTCNVNGAWEPEVTCVPVTCNMLWTLGNITGEYDAFDVGSMKTIKIFCLFRANHGYTYIPRTHLNDVTDLSRYYTRTDHVMVRHVRSDTAEQYEGKFEPLSFYSANTNITVLLNSHGDFPAPTHVNTNQPDNYIYLQSLPSNFIFYTGVKQGYRFQNYDVQFARIEGVAEFNYLVIYNGNKLPNALNNFARNCGTNYYEIGCRWISYANKVDVSDRLPQDYFYHYTMHMGGGGVMLHQVWYDSPSVYSVTGVTFGFRFDL